MVYLKTRHRISELDTKLLQVFAVNVGIAFDNIHLNEELADTQAEIILTLSEVVETRSHETGRHVFRVGAYSRLLGELLGLSTQECDLLQMAAPMHDVGKIGIPDAILNKPGRYTSDEFEQMKHHAAMGRNILKGSQRLPLRSAAIIAGQHHEHWDGTGYPLGLLGEEIHIFGRIVAFADVFDALCNSRKYKEAWPVEEVITYVKGRSGTQFDPKIIEAFVNNVDSFIAILKNNPDDAG
jgi:response regulator RpfG family c-di-GMP phosphodiesterase